MSVAGLTSRTALIAGLAVAALLFAGWRKPARAEPRSHRARPGLPVEHHDTPGYRRPGPVRRLLAAGLSTGIGVLIGALLAIVVAFGVALSVIWMTNLLRQ